MTAHRGCPQWLMRYNEGLRLGKSAFWLRWPVASTNRDQSAPTPARVDCVSTRHLEDLQSDFNYSMKPKRQRFELSDQRCRRIALPCRILKRNAGPRLPDPQPTVPRKPCLISGRYCALQEPSMPPHLGLAEKYLTRTRRSKITWLGSELPVCA